MEEQLMQLSPQNIEKIDIQGEEKSDSIDVNIDVLEKNREINAEMVLHYAPTEDSYVNIQTIGDDGEIINKTYQMNFLDITEDSYKVKLIDPDTLEEMVIDSTQLQATAIPIIIGIIVRSGLKWAIKQFGKKAAMQALIELAVEQITDGYGGEVKNASNGKGKVITIQNKKQTIVIRLMEPGSGGREEAYWRMSVGGKALDKSGNYSSDAARTHIDLDESSIQTIKNLIKKFKK